MIETYCNHMFSTPCVCDKVRERSHSVCIGIGSPDETAVKMKLAVPR